MNILKKASLPVCLALFLGVLFTMTVAAGGPPLQENPCAMCHKDFKVILPKAHIDLGSGAGQPCLNCHTPDPARTEANKFSTEIHRIHKGAKTTLDCSSCHAL